MKSHSRQSDKNFFTIDTLAEEFKKHGLPCPHRDLLLLAEERRQFPRRLHLGGPWSESLWKRSEIDAFFAKGAEERSQGGEDE